MSESISSVSMNPSPGADRPPVAKNSGSNGASKDTVSAIHTTKEIVQAELKGQSISIGEEQVIKAIEKANKALEGVATTFEFSIHEKTKQIMVKVIEKETGELIREIPPEKILDMVASICEKAGIIIDEKR